MNNLDISKAKIEAIDILHTQNKKAQFLSAMAVKLQQ